jgi:Acetyltransferase (GNAT) domain
MNVFSSDPFIEAFSKAYFPATPLRARDFLLNGQMWRLPTHLNGDPITYGRMIDFFEPLPSSELQKHNRALRYLAKASHDLVTTEEWFAKNLTECYTPSPLVDWTRFENWDAFTRHVKSRRSNLFSDSRRRRRKLENDLGSMIFTFQDNSPEAFTSCLRCKSVKYPSTQKLFAQPSHVRLLEELSKNDLLVISSLTAGKTVLAVHLGLFWEDRFYWWIPAYEPQYAEYSPGRLLMESVMEVSYQQGHKEFDFLIGGESYKWHYATHVRLVAEMGTPPLSLTIARSIETQLKKQLSRFPGTLEKLKAFKETFRR